MKKQIITGILIAGCVALCAGVWLRSAEAGKILAEPVKPRVIAEIEASPEETLPNLSDITFAPEPEVSEVNVTAGTEVITTEEKTQPVPSEPTPHAISKSVQDSTVPKAGTISVIDGERCMWIPGFGWVKDEGGGSVGISVDGEGDINKQVGVMDGGSTVGNPGDELTGHKVGIMGGGTVAEDMYENGHKIGIMNGAESEPSNSTQPPAEIPEPTGEVIYVPLQPPVTKDSTPPPYKPNGEPYNP